MKGKQPGSSVEARGLAAATDLWLKGEHVWRNQDQRFRDFVESVEDYAIYAMDTRGVVQNWNRGAERMKGYTEEEIVGRNFEIFYTADDRASGKPREALKAASSLGKFETEGWRVRKDGTQFLANAVIRPLYSSEGERIGFSKVTRDLTESQEAQAEYRTLLEGIPDAIVIVDKAGIVLFINARTETLFQFGRDEVVGKSVDMLVPPRTREAQALYRDILFEGQAHPSPAMPPDIMGLRKDGSEFPLEFTVSPIHTKNGQVQLFSVRDLTARQKLEKRFRDLLESAPDAMVMVDSTGLIEVSNRQTEKLFGFSRQQLVGQSIENLLPSCLSKSQLLDQGLDSQDAAQTVTDTSTELTAMRNDGSSIPVEMSFSPLEGPEGISLVTAIRDITERKRAAQQLAEKIAELRLTNEALEQFAHIASHDLQEPLRMVSSYVQLLAKRYRGKLDSDADDFIGFALDGTRRMKHLIEDLLVYSKAGEKGLLRHNTSSEAAFKIALEDLRASLNDSGAVVTHDPLPVVFSVGSQLVQVFQNLIGNAIKYRAGRVPLIHVAAERNEQEWIFSVKDNGIGIASEHYERIFQIFQRLHGRGDFEGTGIGLAICQRILSQQGGRIWVQSVPGEGSTFFFSLLAGNE